MRILPKNKWARRFVKWFAIPVGVIVLLLVAGWVVLSIVGHVQLKNAIAESRAMGGSVTWEEVVAKTPKSPASAEGTRLVLEACEEMRRPENEMEWEERKEFPIEGWGKVDRRQPLPPSTAAKVEERMRKMQPVLEKLRRGVDLGAVLWPAGAESPVEPAFRELDNFNRCYNLLALSVLYHANRGDAAAALSDISVGMKLAAALDFSAGYDCAWYQAACRERMLRQLESVLSLTDADAEALKRLQAEVSALEGASFLRALDAERARVMYEYEKGDRGRFAGEAEEIITEWGGRPPGRRLNDTRLKKWLMATYPVLGGWRAASAAGNLRWVNEGCANWGMEWYKFSRLTRSMEGDWLVRYYTASRIEGAKKSELSQQSFMRFVRTAISVELYRRAKGKLPEKPGDLVPEFMADVPADPFQAGEISFLAEDGGLAIVCPSQSPEAGYAGRWKFTVYPKVKR